MGERNYLLSSSTYLASSETEAKLNADEFSCLSRR